MRKLMILFLALLCLTPAFSLAESEMTASYDFADNFPGKFLEEGEEIIFTPTSYKSQNISIEITTQRVDKADVYVADIYVRSVENFQRAFAGDKWGKTTRKVKTQASGANAVLAMTGDNGHYFKKGWVFGNGVMIRDTGNRIRDIAILYKNGEMVGIRADDIDNDLIASQAEDIWHSFLFGPTLLDAEGKAYKEFDSNVSPKNPRSVIGYYEPGHYCFVQIDGRKTNSKLEKGKTNQGLDLTQTAAFMESLGCKAAYNLDGGQSSMLWFGHEDYTSTNAGGVISAPFKGGRPVGDIVLIKEID